MSEVLRIDNLKQYYYSGKGLLKKGYVIKAVNGVSFFGCSRGNLGIGGGVRLW
ncbi:hypothetical protein QW180_27820 [Vibrio sinaloensis]|nr:hypothetical protein [Vibrio sinaloensis]